MALVARWSTTYDTMQKGTYYNNFKLIEGRYNITKVKKWIFVAVQCI